MDILRAPAHSPQCPTETSLFGHKILPSFSPKKSHTMPKLGIGLTRVSQRLTGAPWGDFGVPASASVIKLLILLVPGEGFEPPDQRFTKPPIGVVFIEENYPLSRRCRTSIFVNVSDISTE
jgi:hypothetical protein